MRKSLEISQITRLVLLLKIALFHTENPREAYLFQPCFRGIH